MACDILSIPISIVAFESTFSIGGRVLDQYHNSLKPNTVKALVCAGDWLRYDFGVDESLNIDEESMQEVCLEVPSSSNFYSGSKLLNSYVEVMDMLREYDGLPVIVVYVERGDDPFLVVTIYGCLVVGPRLRLTYGEKSDIEQCSSDKVGNEEYGGSDRVVNEDKVNSDCEEGSDNESWYTENIEIIDDNDDILDYC
ncbi:hypothetical protein F0562_025249 [Nyssa sinensis]|uniref:HAT C-terminal dimerisation domain-containing protein n=1 Tax=Nyssa sinensis TaxID=561372 RepID=A0A5J5BF97_9ASTE|nr:hypothetical protein F0562_025249 [Nyssa sinensis]